MNISNMLTAKRSLRQRMVLAVAGLSFAAIMGSAGVAAANPQQRTMLLPNKETCSSRWHEYKFKNRGACTSYWNHAKSKQLKKQHQSPTTGQPGSGYGGNNGGVVVIINGGNVVINIYNYFINFGG